MHERSSADDAPAPRPRRGLRTTLFQPREPAFWFYAVLVTGAGAATVREQARLFAESPPGWLLAWALLVGYLATMFFALRSLDRYGRQAVTLAVGALLWGALAAPALAGVANRGWSSVLEQLAGADFAARWAAAVTGPIVEEPLKALGLVLLYLIASDHDGGLVDGFISGALVGLGFTVVESSGYLLDDFQGTAGGVLQGFVGRVAIDGFVGHMVYTGLIGIAIAYAASRRDDDRGRRVLVALGLCLAAGLAHFLWNAPVLNLPLPLLTPLLKGGPFLAVLVLILVRVDRSERHRMAAALGSELDRPGLLAPEVPILLSRRLQRRERAEVRRVAGWRQAVAVRRLRHEQLKLAETASRLADPESPDLVVQRELCRSLRESLMVTAGLGRSWVVSNGHQLDAR